MITLRTGRHLLLVLIAYSNSYTFADILLNGSFELPNDNSYFWYQGETIGEGWVVAPDSASAAVRSIPGSPDPVPFHGNHFVLFSEGAPGGSIYQDFQVTTSDPYFLTFYMRHAFTLGTSTMLVDIFKDNNSIFTNPPTFNAGGAEWERKNVFLNPLVAGNYRLRFYALGSPFLDAVSLSSTVPEPNAVTLLIAAALFCNVFRTQRFRTMVENRV